MTGTCKDCGKPVRLSTTCDVCGIKVFHHVSAADTWACCGRGVHVQAAA